MNGLGKIGVRRALAGAGTAAAAAGLLIFSDAAGAAARQAVGVCLELLIPSLFPFFVVSGLILGCGYAEAASGWFSPLMRGLFGISGACAPAFLLGLVGGYPVGARTAISLYRKGACTKEEAERMLAFCNNSGPAFVLGVVGTGIFGNLGAGVLLYAAHILASVTVGIVFRFWKGEQTGIAHAEGAAPGTRAAEGQFLPGQFMPSFLDSVKSAGTSVLSICAFVVVFAVLIALLIRSGLLHMAAQALSIPLEGIGLDAAAVEKLLTGFLEVTAGLTSLAELPMEMTEKMAAASCMLGWAGLCVHCQVLSFLQASGVSARPYLLGKLAQGALAAVWIRVLVRLFPVTQASSVLLQLRLEALSAADARGSVYTALVGALGVLLVMAICAIHGKKAAKR